MMLKKLTLTKRAQTDPLPEALLTQACDYIEAYWPNLLKTVKKDTGTLVGLPHPYIVPAADPNAAFQFEEQYYWDSYFTTLGLSGDKYQALAEGMLDNLIYLYKRFGLIPNASRMYSTSRSQPPLLTSFIWHIFETYKKDISWLREYIQVAKDEYTHVWMHNKHPLWHNVHHGLSRYYDINVLHDLAEAESGWDMTPRFERKCLDFLPVDLNALLYKYETDFARADALFGDQKGAEQWRQAAARRQEAMRELMWSKLRGFYFDYNYQRKTRGDVWSLAGFYPMWAGLATPEEAKRMVDQLSKFERKGGLATTARPVIDPKVWFGSIKVQWAYPNGWAPLQYIVIEGLRRYGYHDEANRIARKWLQGNLAWFEAHGTFLEKYNVVNPLKHPVEGVYPSQTGFGWTNGVFMRLVKDLNSTQ